MGRPLLGQISKLLERLSLDDSVNKTKPPSVLLGGIVEDGQESGDPMSEARLFSTVTSVPPSCSASA